MAFIALFGVQFAVAQQAAYNLTVNVTSHPFGNASVLIHVTAANGYDQTVRVATAGGPSYTFSIPSDQGNTVRVCVSGGILFPDNCQTYQVTGGDMVVSMGAP